MEDNKQKLEGVLMELGIRGITALHIYYEGSGDSGSIDYIEYSTDSTKDCEDAEDYYEKLEWHGGYKDGALFKSGTPEFTTIEELAHENVLDKQEDWWNNEGGFGDMYIEIPSGKFVIENNVRIVSIDTQTEYDSLIDRV